MNTAILLEVFYLSIYLAFIIFLFWFLLHTPKEGGRWARISAALNKRFEIALIGIGKLIALLVFIFLIFLLCQIGFFGIILAIILVLVAISICSTISKTLKG